MQTAEIIFKFEGRDADRHRMEPTSWFSHEQAARQLLGLYACFLTTGKTPPGNVLSHLPDRYRVYVAGRSEGSLQGHWMVELLCEEAVRVAAGYAIKKGAGYAYTHLLKGSFDRMLGTYAGVPPTELRREPYFEPVDKSNYPFIDREPDATEQWGQLQGRGAAALESAARPIIRGDAESLTLRAANDNVVLVTLGISELLRLQRDAFAWRRDQVTAAVHALPARRRPATS